MKAQPTQRDLVLKHLVRYGCITDTQARDKYGIARLAARIHELRRNNGAHIYSVPLKFTTRLGRSGTCEEYRMTKPVREFWRETLKGAK